MAHHSESSPAGALIAAGMAAFADGDNERARQLLSQAVRIAPQDERGWLGLGMALGEPERRIYCLERCLQINPGNVQAQQVLAALRSAAAPPQAPSASAPGTASQAPGAAEPAPASATPLASRLAAAAARKSGDAPPAASAEIAPRSAGAPPLPPAIGESGEIKRRPRISAVVAPPALRPIALSQPHEEGDGPAREGRLSDEEIAEAALHQLLRRDEERESDARRSSAANIAQRYFGRSTTEGGQREQTPPPEALRALGMAPRPRARGRVAALLTVVIGLIIAGALLLGALLRAQEALRLAPDAPYARYAAVVIAVVAPDREAEHP